MKRFWHDTRGEAHLGTVVFLYTFCAFLAVLLSVFGIFAKYYTAERALKRSLVGCATSNLNLQYGSLIEGDSYSNSTDYTVSAYSNAFFTQLQNSFSNDTLTTDNDESVLAVQSASGSTGFTVTDLQFSVAPANVPMPDTKTIRLVYTATGTLQIPISGFGYSGAITVPLKATASFQNTV